MMKTANTIKALAEAAAREAALAKRWRKGDDPDWEDAAGPKEKSTYHRENAALLATAANALRKAARA